MELIDEIHKNLIKNADLEIFNASYNMEESILEEDNIVDEVERIKQRNLEKSQKVKSQVDVLDIVLYAIVIVLGIGILYGLYDIHKIKEEIAIEQEQQRIEFENEQQLYEERQRQARLKYLDVSLTDSLSREIKLSYPKEFIEVSSSKESKSFKSEYDDTLDISMMYDTSIKDLKEESIKELEHLGININEFSDIINIGGMQYYTEKHPNVDSYNYIITCDCGNGTLVKIEIKQSSTLITKEYIEEYIQYLDETLDY